MEKKFFEALSEVKPEFGAVLKLMENGEYDKSVELFFSICRSVTCAEKERIKDVLYKLTKNN